MAVQDFHHRKGKKRMTAEGNNDRWIGARTVIKQFFAIRLKDVAKVEIDAEHAFITDREGTKTRCEAATIVYGDVELVVSVGAFMGVGYAFKGALNKVDEMQKEARKKENRIPFD